MYLSQFHYLGHLFVTNYQIWWIFDEVLTKTIWEKYKSKSEVTHCLIFPIGAIVMFHIFVKK